MVVTGTEKHRWWKECIVYQVYPSSFLDTNGDGWGDVAGITSKLDYIKDLGADVVWLSPIYKSPQADMGYDVADYKDIDPRYGTLADVDRLIHELHKREMKLIMDLVVNHTSNEHSWFSESRSSLDNPRRNWYIWKKPRYNELGRPEPPNNWAQLFKSENSAWTFDEKTGEYYLSLFTPEQPDLNWENPEVREAVHDVMHFWLRRGVSGYRMDVINVISKVQSFPDAEVVLPDQRWQPGFKHFANGPRMHEFLKEMNREVLSKYDALTVGEMPWVREEDEILKAVGSQAGELNMIFIFDIVDIDTVPGRDRFSIREWNLKDLKSVVHKWQRTMAERDGWNSLFIENHDNPRSVSRYVDDRDAFRERGAKLLALMQATLTGTLYVYQGEELGLRNVPTSWGPEEYKDIESTNFWERHKKLHSDDPEKLAEGWGAICRKARDHSRTPMQWTSAPHAGFTRPDVTPWMRVNDDYEDVNAEKQLGPDDPEKVSVWRFWQRCLAHRKAHRDAFVYGDFELLDADDDKVFAYLKTGSEAEAERWIIALNWTGDNVDWEIPEAVQMQEWLMDTVDGKHDLPTLGVIELEPWQGLLGRCHL
ncbi:MAG: hypothetical protein M1816_001905 [Peltula sp. TS41687]|nr:MAG: hypothetical protein M1816_001905 [Peltula sp. TS41687]